ncbi:MAG: hypothetical protein CL583_12840 [Alteromonadaceae bacterium]|nr:hypothetical protein [Alteromonadaceae bacterium]|tara:strand:+ start:877 stop:2913 length:2037 start_codon:yes stop_codon:yes gene_type:complete
MAEAEDVITDAAEHATAYIVDYWQRKTHTPVPFHHTLKAHRKRLEFLLQSLFNQKYPVRMAQAPAAPTFLTRLFTRRPKRLFQTHALPGQDGTRIFLPAEVTPIGSPPLSADALYRIYAIQQVQRARRREAAQHYSTRSVRQIEKNTWAYLFFLLSEAANADRDLVRLYPGLGADLIAMRDATLAGRPELKLLQHAERDAEKLYGAVLRSPPNALPEPIRPCSNAGESLDWALEQAGKNQPGKERFWGILPDAWIGVWLTPEAVIQTDSQQPWTSDPGTQRPDERKMARRPRVREREDDEEDPNAGIWMVQPAIPMEHVEDPMGMQRPADREQEADAGGMSESLSELQETTVVTTPEPAKEIMTSDEKPARDSVSGRRSGLANGISYPEWDYQADNYRAHGTIVRLLNPALGNPDWVTAVNARNRRQLADVRRRFEAMRTRRQAQRRQIDGDDIDIEEYVSAFADQRAGLPVSERLFQCDRNLRRDCAVLLLIDISGSTDAWVSGGQRIIDVAKESLVLVTSALEALGDPYAIQAFSGEGPGKVCVTEIKHFDTQATPTLYRRIAALEPDRFTRVGAALRHATATLMESNAQNRLLIVLSDGKPNDVDQYESRYGVEDTRKAVAEASMQGIHPFCITVDREAPEYMPYMFGPRRYAMLPQVDKLPVVLLDLLGRFIRG